MLKLTLQNGPLLELLHGATLTITPLRQYPTMFTKCHIMFMETKSENQELATIKDLSCLKTVNSLLKSRNYAQKPIGKPLKVRTRKLPTIASKTVSLKKKERYRNSLRRKVQKLEEKLQKINGDLSLIQQRKETFTSLMQSIPSNS